MVVVRSLAFTLAAVLLLSGCASQAKPQTQETLSATASPSAGFGSIGGQVLDEEDRPIAGAQVGMIRPSLNTTTDAEGKFVFNDLEPGEYEIAVGRLGYESAAQRVKVVSDEVAPFTIRLKAYVIPSEAVVRTLTFNGMLQCSFNPYYFVNPCGSALGENKDHFRFDLDATLPFHRILLELTWVPTSAATGQELEMDFCVPPVDASSAFTGCFGRDVSEEFYAYESGPAPVVINLTAEEVPHVDFKTYEAWIGNGIYSPTPSFQQPFTLYVTKCYAADCPPGTTGLPPS